MTTEALVPHQIVVSQSLNKMGVKLRGGMPLV